MAKDQFQSTENIEIRLPPFTSKSDGSEVSDEVDVTLKITKPNGTTLSDVTLTRASDVDANTGYWKYSLLVANYMEGTWLVKAISNGGTAAFNQRKVYNWGEYVDDITAAKTAAEAAEIAAGAAQTAAESADGKCTAIQAKTDNLPSDPADESLLEAAIAGVQADATAIKAVTDALPTFPSDPADESTLEAAIGALDTKLGAPVGASVSADVAAVKSDTAAIKLKTDVPAEIASALAVSTISTNLATVKNIVTELQTITKGHWKVVGYQLILYDEMDAVIQRFNLYDDVGAPTNSRIFERVPV
jgi:hypothetical protein